MHSTGITLAKTRRKHMVVRAKSGRASEAGQREFPPAQVKRLRDAAMRGLRDPEWGTELGRLYLEGSITSTMYAAGRRWSEWARDYQSAIDVFPIRSITLERGRRGEPPDPESPQGQEIARRERNATERFFEAHAVLVGSGMLVEGIVRRVCEMGGSCDDYAEFQKLRTGLSALAAHWGLDSIQKIRTADR